MTPQSKIDAAQIQSDLDKNSADDSIETSFNPFPKPDEKCFYGLAGDFVKLLEPHTEADNMSLLSQFLAYFGNIVGRCAYFQVEGDLHYTNIFLVVVGNSSMGRKGTSFGRVRQVFQGIDEVHERNCVTSGLASGEGLLWQVRDAAEPIKPGMPSDTGISDKRLLVVEGEFAQVLKKQGTENSTLSTTIRNLWDTGTTKSLTKNSPVRTTGAHVSIIGHITQTELLLTFKEVDSANGYANRFLYFLVARSKFLPFGSEVPKIELGRLRDRLKQAIEFARGKSCINFSLAARDIWKDVYKHLETSRSGYLAKITQRASPYVLRLSLIFALLDESPLIDAQHLEAALAVWKYSEDSARFIFGEKLDNPTAEKILNGLKEKSPNGFTRTEIRDLFSGHGNKKQIDTALQYLKDNNLARMEKSNTGGRPVESWFVCDKSDKSDEF